MRETTPTRIRVFDQSKKKKLLKTKPNEKQEQEEASKECYLP